jgi:hypothetical protein
VHGIANKPIASVLKCQWDLALTRTQLGDRSRMAYWVNRTRYPTPLRQTCADGGLITSAVEEGGSLLLARAASMDSGTVMAREVDLLARDPAEQAFLLRIAERMQGGNTITRRGLSAQDVREKILPLPDPVRRLVTQALTKALLEDVHDFFFVEERRKAQWRTVSWNASREAAARSS